MANRKAATALAVKIIGRFMPGSPNAAITQELLDELTDEQFDALMHRFRDGSATLTLYSYNLDKHKLSLDRNLKIAKIMGHEFFQRLYLTDPITGVTFLTPERYLILRLPVRRQQQLLIKKSSIPDSNLHVDELTGQPAGPSKGSKMSFPEIQVLFAQDQNRPIEELIKFRGGDAKAYRAMTRSIIETGQASQDAIKVNPTRVKSTETFSTLLKAMHLANTL
jgi:hypothetical protein